MVTENLNFAIAFLAGIISFISPCILPIIPSYLSFIGGISYTELAGKKISKWGIFIKTLFFVAGFSIIFIALGVVFSSAGTALSGASRLVNMVAGTVVIVLGLNFIFDFWKILSMDKRVHFQKRPSGIIGSVLLGMAFGAGWTPCVGPILASILFLAGASSRIFEGTALLAVYSFGLGIPFILAGLFFSTFETQMKKIRPHLHTIKIASGVFLIILGVLIFMGSFAKMNVFLFTLAGDLEAWNEVDPLGPRLLFGLILLIFSLVLTFFYLMRVFRMRSSADLSIQSFFLPLRLMSILFFAATAILTFTGTLNIPKIIALWLTFQGI